MRIFVRASKCVFAERLNSLDHEFVFDSSPLDESDAPLPRIPREAVEAAAAADCDLAAFLPNAADAEVLKKMLAALPDADRPTAVVLGRRKGIRHMDKRAEFLLQLLTGETIPDFASPISLYPVKLLSDVPESVWSSAAPAVDILVFASRSGYALRQVEVDFEIPDDAPSPSPIPISYFISRALSVLSPIPAKRLCERNFQREAFKEFIAHPFKFISFLLRENASPAGLASAAAVGMFFGTVAIPGLHTAAIIYVSVKLRLNKMMSVNISHLCMPPFVPIACMELGHFALNGKWLIFDSIGTVVDELPSRALEWGLGSLILAPVNAVAFWFLTYAVATFAARLRNTES